MVPVGTVRLGAGRGSATKGCSVARAGLVCQLSGVQQQESFGTGLDNNNNKKKS